MAAYEVLFPLRPTNSRELPPDLSELRVVLLGNSWSHRSSAGNLMLRTTEFNTEEEANICQRAEGKIKEKKIVVINTPDLLHPNISEDKLTEFITDCVSLSDPGPHVFLLVLQPEDFTEDHKLRLCRVLKKFSGQSFDHSMVLMSPPVEASFMEQPLKDMILICRNKHLTQKNLERSELLKHMLQIVKNTGGHVICDMSGDIRPALNLVLCGRTGAGKTSAAEAILGLKKLHPASNSQECVKHQAEVFGRRVSVVELPALYGEPQEVQMEESFRCISLCEPEGVHAFILVLPVGPLNDEDKGELKTIQTTFSSGVNDFTMILFTVESDPAAPAVVDFVGGNKAIQELLQSCGGRHVVLNIKDRQQIPEMLDAVGKMTAEGSRCFTMKMFTKAQMEKSVLQEKMNKRLQAELQEVKRRSEMGGVDEDQSRETLRMVLIGKSGNGKSATANTILGKKHFKPRITPKPATKSCERATGEVEGRPVLLVNTPALFDMKLSEEEVHPELQRCFSMLAPGPHVFLLVLQIGNFTHEEKDSVELIKKIFGKKSEDFIVIIFTRGDELEDQSFESYVDDCDDFVRQLINECSGRYQVFNNKDDNNHTQVRELLSCIETMVRKNGGCYTTEMFQLQNQNQRHQEEMQQIKSRMEETMEEMRQLRQDVKDMKLVQAEKKKKCRMQ